MLETIVSGEFDSDAAIIWLHGLGATADDFVPLLPELDLTWPVVFPQAPVIPVTINAGYQMPAWFDVKDLNSLDFDVDEVQAAIEDQNAIIAELEERGVNRICIVGFSLGGALALATAMQNDNVVAAASLSGFMLPEQDTRDLPVFLAHGEYDDVVPLRMAERSYEDLDAQVIVYPMGHEVCARQVADLKEFIESCLL